MLKKIAFILAIIVVFANVPKFKFEFVQFFEQEEQTEYVELLELEFESYVEVEEFFNKIGYDLAAGVVPMVILKRLPNDLGQINDVKKKKDLFVKILLPIIIKVNKEIYEEREKIVELPENSPELSRYLTKYKAKNKQELLEKVMPIPVEIALAQAAIESAWGTSRFAIEANNIFGELTFKPGNGVVPKERPEDEIYEVRRFPDLLSAVRSYAYNLNVSPFYREFRAIRSGKINKPLADGLIFYSQRREEYVREIKLIISANRFAMLNEHKAAPILLAYIGGLR
ncbi:glucosaminidase domain-containing protein [Pseudothermotoga thermarum]|uniref:Mannosyl-glycoprotein endo-beta-N-acetylglucosamidase-like domain-containing protein n=1 Tax=Pseudothermotoga thermarum DSM 5069 TaxID=688269 RepID=F7YUL2_9THEM|nr:glucosaminidase domain-containing protein [Pseudothermotoga thermarum]AEH51485.1 hypothetical protein Theth_1426 [Pseudothermotoga thermarum DSM 5069]